MRRPAIAVIGPGRARPEIEALAEEVGRLVAAAGADLVTGGLGGVMDAASRGAAGAGGRVVAVLPGTDGDGATAHADVVVSTGTGEARDLAVVASARAVIAVGAGWGTLAEIGLARKLGRPVVLLESWSLRAPGGVAADGCRRAEDPAEAVALATEGV